MALSPNIPAGLGLALLLGGCASFTHNTSNQAADVPKQMAARQVLVTLPDSLKPKWESIKLELAKNNALEETGEFPLTSINVDCLVYKVPEGKTIDSLLATLRADKRVVLAQQNQVFEGIQGGESDALAAISYAPKALHADAAHHITSGKGIKIAVIDTGAEKDHPDLKGRLQKTVNFVEGGESSFSSDKHGTAISGAIGARADDGVGIYGIAPEADISVYKACWYPEQADAAAQCSSWTLAKALDAAIGEGANIINLSLAGPEDELLTKLLEKAHDKNIAVVAAALEKQDSPGFPASLPFAIPVIASAPDNKVNKPAWLAHYPQTVAAPGVDILSAVPKEAYDFVSGSSLATAHVSGVIALLLQLNPALKPEDVKKLLNHNNPAQGADSELPVLDICAIINSLNTGPGC